jgi:hypothetical protein
MNHILDPDFNNLTNTNTNKNTNKNKNKKMYYKENETLMEEYIEAIHLKGEKHIPYVKNPAKIKDEDVTIPTIHNYTILVEYNYNIQQLKQFAKHYKLKIGGNKKEIIKRVFIYLFLSSYLIKIQKRFRGLLQKKYNAYHGPGFFKRTICTNETDFITMEELTQIPYYNFFSYKDTDGFIYGFELSSLHNLILKSQNQITNPYNRNKIPLDVIHKMKMIIRFSAILKLPIQLTIENEMPLVSDEKMLELDCLSLFQKIDELGNYSDPKWFLSLNRHQLIKFIRELGDIWDYRAQLSEEVKRNILPPNGSFLMNIHIHLLQVEQNFVTLKKNILKVIEKLVTCGIDRDSKSLGAYYILGALTIVNHDAANALPWLYQSMS